MKIINNINIRTKDMNQLRYLCDKNPTCVDFNTAGDLYNATGTIYTTSSVTLYTKINMI